MDLCRLLPDKYDVEIMTNKYTKVFYDLIPEIKYLLSDSGHHIKKLLSSEDLNLDDHIEKYDYKMREYISRLIEEYIANKFGIEVENI